MIQISYRVAAKNHRAFLEALRGLGRIRGRDGGYGWRIFQDPEDPESFIEISHAPSWTDHLRHHGRVTEADADLQAGVPAFP